MADAEQLLAGAPRSVTPESQRTSRPRWYVHVLRALLVLLVVVPVPYVAAAAFAPLPATTIAEVPVALTPGAAPVIDWPHVQGAGVSVVGMPGSVMVSGREDPLPLASIAKLATVLTVLDARPLGLGEPGESVTITQADVDAMSAATREAAPILPVRTGQVVTVRALVDAAIVMSAANATTTLARWAFGSEEAFVEAANAWAARHGLASTTIAEPVGMSVATTATMTDMVRLGELAVAEPVVLEAMGTPRIQVEGLGWVQNTNPLLGTHDIDAGKTGTLFVAGRNLLLSAERVVEGVPRRVIAVVAGATSADERNAVSLQLLTSVWPNIAQRELLPAGTRVGVVETAWGERVDAVTTAPLVATVWGQTLPAVTVDLEAVPPGAQRGVGTLEARLGDDTTVVDVRTTGIVREPDVWWRITHPEIVVDWVAAGFATE